MTDYISPKEFAAAAPDDWRVIGDGACAYFKTDSLAQAAQLVTAIATIPGIEDHQPDLDVRPDGVTVRLLSKSAEMWGMSKLDVGLAGPISEAAKSLGLASDPSAVQSFLVVAGSSHNAEVMPFWQAVLGYERRADTPDEDLVDPRGRLPGFWFEQMKEPRADRGGGDIHVAVWVPVEQAKARVDAALAAGGHIVRDNHAPSWWTLADSAGNEVDVSTIENRE